MIIEEEIFYSRPLVILIKPSQIQIPLFIVLRCIKIIYFYLSVCLLLLLLYFSIFLIVWCWNKFKLRKQPREDQNEIMLLEVSRDGELSYDESHDDKDTLESAEE